MLKLYVKAQQLMQSMKNESGQDMIEYALLGALIAIVVAAAIPALTAKITAEFGLIEAAL